MRYWNGYQYADYHVTFKPAFLEKPKCVLHEFDVSDVDDAVEIRWTHESYWLFRTELRGGH